MFISEPFLLKRKAEIKKWLQSLTDQTKARCCITIAILSKWHSFTDFCSKLDVPELKEWLRVAVSRRYAAQDGEWNATLAQQVATLSRCLSLEKLQVLKLSFHPLYSFISSTQRSKYGIFCTYFKALVEDEASAIENWLWKIFFVLGQFHQTWRNIIATQAVELLSNFSPWLMGIFELGFSF